MISLKDTSPLPKASPLMGNQPILFKVYVKYMSQSVKRGTLGLEGPSPGPGPGPSPD